MAPPTLGWEEQEEGMDLDYVPNEAQPLKVNGRPPIALSNAFGFGGHNAVLCLEAA
jgi:3-oxoacyl-[acyl-carrier-protein] synthase II